MKYVILHNIRSAHNVGAIFRTADGAGVQKIYLTGYTPSPVDRFGRIQPEVRKTSLGATDSVGWEQVESIREVIQNLKKEGVEIVAVEQHKNSIDYREHASKKKVAYIFGNEVEGVDDALCEFADIVIEVPMAGKKESLNVSVAAGVVLFSTSIQ